MTKYIYHSEKEKNTCEECRKNDGRIFYDVNDVPKLPIHPHCKCWIETIEEEDENKKCDCGKRIKKIKDDFDNLLDRLYYMLQEIKSLKSDVSIDKSNADNYILEDSTYINGQIEKFENYLLKLEDETKNYQKLCENLLIDVAQLEDNYFDPTYHTENECKISSELNEYEKKVVSIENNCAIISCGFNKLYEEIKIFSERIEGAVKSENSNSKKILIGATIGENGTDDTLEYYASGKFDSEKIAKDIKKKEKDVIGEVNLRQAFIFGATLGDSLEKIAGNKKGPDAAGLINVAARPDKTSYLNGAVRLNNVYDNQLSEYDNGSLKAQRKEIETTIKEQFKDFKYDVKNVKGYIFKESSDPVLRIKKSQDLKDIIIKNKSKILRGENFSGEFKEEKLRNAYHYVKFLNPYFDKFGNLHIKMFDTYDFNKSESPLVEAGRREMMKGNLKGFFTIHDIIILKSELAKYGL